MPGGGNDIALELLCVSAGAAMGAVGGLATRLRLGAGGRPLGRAGWLAASMWVGGVGARMAFAFAATHGAGPAIARFSIAHHITGSDAWVAALVMMALADVLTRLVVVYLRGRRLAAGPAAAPAPVPAGAGALIFRSARRGPDCVHEGTAGSGGPYSWHRAARSASCCGRGRRARFGPGGGGAISRPRAR